MDGCSMRPDTGNVTEGPIDISTAADSTPLCGFFSARPGPPSAHPVNRHGRVIVADLRQISQRRCAMKLRRAAMCMIVAVIAGLGRTASQAASVAVEVGVAPPP